MNEILFIGNVQAQRPSGDWYTTKTVVRKTKEELKEYLELDKQMDWTLGGLLDNAMPKRRMRIRQVQVINELYVDMP